MQEYSMEFQINNLSYLKRKFLLWTKYFFENENPIKLIFTNIINEFKIFNSSSITNNININILINNFNFDTCGFLINYVVLFIE